MIYVTHDQIEALTLADRVAVMNGGVIQQLASPKEIYQRPVNRFVAGFVGSPAMNFVSGKLDVSNGELAMVCADGIRIGLAGYGFAGKPDTGRTVVLGVRPEQIHLIPALPESTSLRLKLTVIEPMGADSLLWGEVGSETVSIRANSDETHAIGERVDAYFQPSRASLFDAETGARL
jgi:multiple sugar transport system ATP-binding protein